VRGIKKSAPPWIQKYRAELLRCLTTPLAVDMRPGEICRVGPDAAAGSGKHVRGSHFDRLDKLRTGALLRCEQKGICVYCEIKLAVQNPQRVRITHWRPLSKTPEMALDWHNLYLSCSNSTTCDVLQDDRRFRWDDSEGSTEEDLPPPVDLLYEHCLGFRKDGRAYIKDDAPLTATQRRALRLVIEDQVDDAGRTLSSILNLNSKTLVAARKAAIKSEGDALGRDFPHRKATAAERAQRAAALLAATEYSPFVSARVAYLTRSGRKKG
jgi:uncharacterized protein (TIGR02646 family)